jgi:hypothetical protein
MGMFRRRVIVFVRRLLAIGLGSLSDSELAARFDHLDRNNSSRRASWESIEGTLVLTQTGDSISGSFSFSAVRTPDGSESVIVAGNFEGVPVGP